MLRRQGGGRLAVLFLAALLPSAWLAWNYGDMPQLGHFHDDEIYFSAGRSLASGEGYRIANLPERPWQTKYPPLYPLWLSLVWRLDGRFPGNLGLATLLNWVLVAPLFAVSLAVFRDLGLGRLQSWLLLGFMAVNPYLCFLSITLMAEAPFAVLALSSLLVAGRAARPRAAWWVAAAAGALGGAAYLTKAVGLALLAAVPAAFVLKKQWRLAAWYAAGMLPWVAAWNLWAHAHLPAGNDWVTLYYNNYLGFQLYNVTAENFLSVVWHNVNDLATGMANLLVFQLGVEAEGAPWRRSLCWVLAVGTFSGLRRLAVRAGGVRYLAYAAAFSLVLVVWHYPPTDRLVLPLMPLLAAGIAAELAHLAGNLRRAVARSAGRGQRVTAVAMGAGLVALLGWTALVTARALVRVVPASLDAKRELARQRRQAYQWIARHTPAGARFVAANDAQLTLYTGQASCRVPSVPKWLYQGDRAQFLLKPLLDLPRFMRARGLDYLLVTAGDYERDLTAEERARAAARLRVAPELERLWEGPGAEVYRLRREVKGLPAPGP